MPSRDLPAPQEFLQFACEEGVLRFGSFQTKAGRLSPYFFNTGAIQDGESLRKLSDFYARAYIAFGLEADTLFGSAYKGIPLVAALATALAARGHNKPFAFNRKEEKDHGEGGHFIGAPLRGRVLMVDDVLSAGTSARECCQWIRAAHAEPAGLLVAFDRQERGVGTERAATQLAKEGFQVFSLARLDDLSVFFDKNDMPQEQEALKRYRLAYG